MNSYSGEEGYARYKVHFRNATETQISFLDRPNKVCCEACSYNCSDDEIIQIVYMAKLMIGQLRPGCR